jgi:hypothetical protein
VVLQELINTARIVKEDSDTNVLIAIRSSIEEPEHSKAGVV